MRKNWTLGILLLLAACNTDQSDEPIVVNSLFTSLPASYTNIDFVNQLDYTEEFNVYTYRNFYNGAGVAMGDVNNDGWLDIFFCGNLVDNKLYLNQGDLPNGEAGFKFEDITQKAGVASKGVWSTGVTMADVNADGWLDIYVCKSGDMKGENRHNELFINNGDPDASGQVTFTERAKEYGIADVGLSTHAAFFDYDKDGDLDCYLLNNSFRSVGGYDLRPGQREKRDPQGGNKLYKFQDGKYVDVSEEAGIYGSAIGFGLGVTVGDVNQDGWQDIFVSNDFFERDYLYINNQDGTFREVIEERMGEISMGSMGADMADINNDGYPEVFVTEMLPEDDARLKTTAQFENWDKYQRNVANGYHHQFGRNVLQLNNQNGTFSEIGRLAGVHATDWSWGALIADYDNDGFKDIFVANGIYKDLLDQDYINFIADAGAVREIIKNQDKAILKLIDSIPSQRIPNYAFHNQGNLPNGEAGLKFKNKAADWGLATPSHSNGSAYGDLDNDGDLDLVVNNVNMPPFIYRNETDTLLGNKSLVVKLIGDAQNTLAVGAKVRVSHDGNIWYQEQMPTRGFQSSVDHRLHFGLGDLAQVQQVKVIWPDGKVSIRENVATGQQLIFEKEKAVAAEPSPTQKAKPLFSKYDEKIAFIHQESRYSDFDKERLLYNMVSAEGPKLAVGDVNKDGLDDFYIGGAKGQSGSLFIQNANGTFKATNQAIFEEDAAGEDTDALFFDADKDGDLDLYVASGSNEFSASNTALKDRLYLNNGRGSFTRSPKIFPAGRLESTACVQASDFDNDGDQDLFVGVRMQPFYYGVPVSGYILKNDGKGNFQDITKQAAPKLEKLGMFTDASWADVDGDNDQDLVVVGDWMPITIFYNNNGDFQQTDTIPQSSGFWNCIKAADLDNDGDLDFVLGNHGENTRFKASTKQPITLYINDFDGNRTLDQIVSVYNGDKSYPLIMRNDMVMQMPILKKKYLKFNNYKNQTVQDIFPAQQLAKSVVYQVETTASAVLLNNGSGQFQQQKLPTAAQLAPMYGLHLEDVNKDGNIDILMGGNFYYSKPEVGIYDASYGVYLEGDGQGNFNAIPSTQSGFFVKGQVKDIGILKSRNGRVVLAARNNDSPVFYFIK